MKGKILLWDANSNTGKISGDDGTRYEFVKMDWKGDIDPKEGLEIDFSVEDGKPKEIFVLKTAANMEGKSFTVTLILALFLGYLGVHRFYTGHTGIGIIQLITIGGCGIWSLIDIIMIISGSYTDAQGNPLTRN